MYRTIVADPPWDAHDGVTGVNMWGRHVGRVHNLTYSVMSVDEIAGLPIASLVHGDGAHLYLWCTSSTLPDALRVVGEWGFQYRHPLVWCKESNGFMGGSFLSNIEFVLYARRGNVRSVGSARSRWYNWPRPYAKGPNHGPDHSSKPEAFLDLVEQVSPGPYVELFARRQRLGWDTWGHEALNHVELPGGE